MRENPDFLFEIQTKNSFIAGVDEAGRGPLCGPVVAAAVMFKNFDIQIPVIIRDSKQMSARARKETCDWLKNNENVIWAIGQASPAEIDSLNILWASMLAMKRAIDNLSVKPECCLIDGNRIPDGVNGMAIVHGDAKSLSIAAASIIAKETRDSIMHDLAKQYPYYGWDKNAGYPTSEHLQAIEKYGINDLFRKSFGPVKKRIADEVADNK